MIATVTSYDTVVRHLSDANDVLYDDYSRECKTELVSYLYVEDKFYYIYRFISEEWYDVGIRDLDKGGAFVTRGFLEDDMDFNVAAINTNLPNQAKKCFIDQVILSAVIDESGEVAYRLKKKMYKDFGSVFESCGFTFHPIKYSADIRAVRPIERKPSFKKNSDIAAQYTINGQIFYMERTQVSKTSLLLKLRTKEKYLPVASILLTFTHKTITQFGKLEILPCVGKDATMEVDMLEPAYNTQEYISLLVMQGIMEAISRFQYGLFFPVRKSNEQLYRHFIKTYLALGATKRRTGLSLNL